MKQRTEVVLKVLFWSVGVTIILVVAWILLKTIFSDQLKIMFGVRIYYGILYAANIALLISSVILAIAIGFLMKFKLSQKKQRDQEQRQRQNQERKEAQFFKEYADNKADTDLVRRMLREIRDDMPEMDGLFEECISQMDMMDIQQKKQSVLIQTNNATYLEDTVEVLNRTEARLCQDIRKIINICITTESVQCNMEAFHDLLLDVKSRVNDAKRLLELSGEWVNSQNEKDNLNDGSEVKLWVKTMDKTLREE